MLHSIVIRVSNTIIYIYRAALSRPVSFFLLERDLWVRICHIYEYVTDVLHMRSVVHNSYICVWMSHVEFNPCPAEPGYTLPLKNSVDPDQLLASEEANWSGSAPFAIKFVNL